MSRLFFAWPWLRTGELGYRQDSAQRIAALARSSGIDGVKLKRMQRTMKKKIDVPGWDNDRKTEWTVGEVLSILRHSRIPDNLNSLRRRGFRTINRRGEPSGVIRMSAPNLTAVLAAAASVDPTPSMFQTDKEGETKAGPCRRRAVRRRPTGPPRSPDLRSGSGA